ncbi:Fe-S cluster assembly protein SufB [Candidatus Dependentiae bacterium]|nr:Fe-S cluster assembly protein SufB [Candidatus Dependentiae bacterium]
MQKKDCFSCSNSCKRQDFRIKRGLHEQTIKEISVQKNEPAWMLEYRLKAYKFFKAKKMQNWGPDLSRLKFDDICFYLKPISDLNAKSWNDVSKNIKKTFDNLGIIKNEKRYLAGLGAQYESEVVYHNLKKEWTEKGIIFLSTDQALKEYPELFKKYFGTVVSFKDNKFSALNSSVWSGGTFIYVPKNVKIDIPLQAYYRINEQNLGQFERTLIIADEGAQVSYIEGCTAPNYSTNSLHSAVVEIIAKKNSKVKYYTVQNWSKNIYNLVTKRALAETNSTVEWIDANIGSGITMKYPSVILSGKNANTSVLSLAISGFKGQIQDSGAKAIHLASDTTSKIISKSISSNGGVCSFRGKVKVCKNAKNCKAFMECDSLITDNLSKADAYPFLDVAELDSDVGHEARVSKIADEQIFYLMSRGISFKDAQSLIINGFIESFVKNLPQEYAIEINRLVEMELAGEQDVK